MTDFWNWAVKAYGGAGVAEACLSLQDEDGQNVPLLLWAAWKASEGFQVGVEAGEAAGLVRDWSEAVIVPLRTMRRRLKMEIAEGDEALRLPLREKIKAAELESERALMTQLAALAGFVNFETNQPVNEAVLANLRAAAVAWGEKCPESGLQGLTQALSEGRFLRYNS